MRALVTGASGFLGKRIVADLIGRGITVRCFLRPTSDDSQLRSLAGGERLDVVRGRLGDPDDCSRAVAGCGVIYHVAAELTGATAVLFLANVTATRTLVAASRLAGVRRFVLVSSLGVYGTAGIKSGGILDEQTPLDSHAHLRDPYSYSKVAQEEVCWEAVSNGFPLVVVRPGVIYGPGRDCLTARVGLKVGNFVLVMGGGQPMPYTHVANCASGVVLAGLTAGVESSAFNLVDDELPTGRELIRWYRREVGRVHRLTVPRWAIGPLSGLSEWYHRASRGQLPAVLTRYKSQAMWWPRRYPNDRAKSGLGWRPTVGLEQGLAETLAWLRANRSVGTES